LSSIGLEIETQAQVAPAKQGKKYMNVIAIGLVSVAAAALIGLGASTLYLNKEGPVSTSRI